MNNRSNDRKEFDLTQNFDAFEEVLNEVENSDDADVLNDSDTNMDFYGENGEKILFLHPQLGHQISSGFVIAHTTEAVKFINADNFYEQDFNQFFTLIALPGNILATRAPPESEEDWDVDGPELKNGMNVTIGDNGEFIAEQYGFITLINRTLSITSPLYIPQDKLSIDWILFPDMPTEITCQMIEFWLSNTGVGSLPNESLEDQIEHIQNKTYAPGPYSLVSGTPPVHGENGKINWLVNIHFSPGKELPDGKIDFKERNYVVNVTDGEQLGVLKPPTQGKSGVDVFGAPVPANDGIALHIEPGDHVKKENRGDDILFYSEMDGAFHFDNNTIFITDILILPEGVHYKTGNITFGGDIIIEGDVESGFAVRAGGDIVVTDSVEDGATLIALGKIVVGSFITGSRALVKAGLSVHAQYVNEATVKAGSDIILGNYARHAKLRAQGLIQVKKNYGKLGGKVVGGEAWAGRKIEVHLAGTKAWVKTELVAGISPQKAEKLDLIVELIEAKNNHMQQILAHFGLLDIDLAKLKFMIESAQGVRKKSMALRAKYLVKTGKQLQKLLAEKLDVEDVIGAAPKDAEVLITEKAYPNTIITIGRNKRKIDFTMGPTRFYQENNVLISS